MKTLILLTLLLIPGVLADFAFQPRTTINNLEYDTTFGTYKETITIIQNTENTPITINITSQPQTIHETQITLLPKEMRKIPITLFINQTTQTFTILYTQTDKRYSGITVINTQANNTTTTLTNQKGPPKDYDNKYYTHTTTENNQMFSKITTQSYTSPLNNLTITNTENKIVLTITSIIAGIAIIIFLVTLYIKKKNDQPNQ